MTVTEENKLRTDMVRLWGVASPVLLVCSVVSLGISFKYISELRQENRSVWATLAKDEKRLDAFEDLKRSIEKNAADIQELSRHQKDFDEGLKELNRGLQENISKTEATKRFSEELNEEFRDLKNRVQFSLQLLSDSSNDAHKPMPFSYYEGPEWAAKIESLQKAYPVHILGQPILDGDGGTDTVNISSGQDNYSIDGVLFKNIEIYNLKNHAADTVTVTVPGFSGLEHGTLEIQTDAAADRIILDGCLKWKKVKNESSLSIWQATDIELATRTLKYSKGTSITVQPTCNNHYLDSISLKAIANLWSYNRDRATQVRKHAPDSIVSPQTIIGGVPRALPPLTGPFAGVGMTYKKTNDGLLIQSVLKDKPAERAGLKAGDVITHIDGAPVSTMTTTDSMTAIRGENGAPVTLLYKASDSPNSIRKVVLKRETIDPAQKP